VETTKYIQNSALAAAMVQQELAKLTARHGIKNRGVKQAMFFVLSQVAMPSLLLEMGFLSNSKDRDRLMNVVFQAAFVEHLTQALSRYRLKTAQ
jgi:N-acetylmuramoyl-L-alanine amidase